MKTPADDGLDLPDRLSRLRPGEVRVSTHPARPPAPGAAVVHCRPCVARRKTIDGNELTLPIQR
ncbi:MAG: hypothetical protein ACRECZ_08975, partial [Methylocella sp.]